MGQYHAPLGLVKRIFQEKREKKKKVKEMNLIMVVSLLLEMNATTQSIPAIYGG